MSKKDEALATRGPQAIDIPAHLRDEAKVAEALNARFEQSELKLPMLRLCQSMSPHRKKSNERFIEGLNEGDFFNDLTTANYGTGPLHVIPVKYWLNFIKFKPLEEGGGIVCRGKIGDDGLVRDEAGRVQRTDWGPNGEKPEITRFMNYLFYLPSHDEVVWFSAKSTHLKPTALYNSSLRLQALMLTPDCAKVSTLESVTAHNQANQEYYAPKFSRQVVHVLGSEKTGPLFGTTDYEVELYGRLKKMAFTYKDKIVDTRRAETTEEVIDAAVVPEDIPF